jgi:putative endonuclease
LECRDGSIYTGIAKDVAARYRQHEAGKGARYTKINPPVRVLASQSFSSRQAAAEAEAAMKRLKPAEKWNWARRMAASILFDENGAPV